MGNSMCEECKLNSQSYDFEVIRDFNHVNTSTTPTPNGHGSTDGITFREEEIEEDDINSFEPKVLDLIKQMNCNPSQQISELSKVAENSLESTEQEDGGDMEIEFEQGLIDAYSDIFAEMKPSDYFNFECEFTKGFDSDDSCSLQMVASDFDTEEIEGEIVE